ncbi:MAG: rRNA pseudouridine synthase [Actinomycetales bacterium]|nr:rRNA pseudouridine synthase [Actinomycetales bacterium]
MEIRLQKYLADAGVASRRACEELIVSGRVSVNGKIVTKLGTKINPENARVALDGKAIKPKNTKTYIAFYKPRGVLSTMSDPSGRSSLSSFFSDWSERLFHVGRLDKESEGLILLTNDGDWAQKIAHPKFGLVKKYRVATDRALSAREIDQLKAGVKIENGVARAISAKRIPEGVEIAIHEGRNQIIRKMMEALGIEVLALIRTEIGSIKLGELKAGKWRYLSDVETLKL